MAWTKQSDGSQSWIKQGLYYFIVTLLNELIYSDSGEEIIIDSSIYGDGYQRQSDGTDIWTKQEG